MKSKDTIRIIHMASTAWFMLCTGYVFILAMWQAGFNWLVIFSLSGYWALITVLLVSLYLFAVFRGTGPGPSMEKEHPLTSTAYYMAFYISTPFLGAIAGLLSMIGETGINLPLGRLAMGTIIATFLTWIAVDPITGLLELLTPQPRRHRAERLAQALIQKQLEQENRKKILARLSEQERENERLWKEAFAPQAERLARLLASDCNEFSKAEKEALNIGVEAWTKGGLICMRYLRNMAADIFKQQYGERQFVDYISAWWDGIGRWRNPSQILR
jgi:hypothetical protein